MVVIVGTKSCSIADRIVVIRRWSMFVPLVCSRLWIQSVVPDRSSCNTRARVVDRLGFRRDYANRIVNYITDTQLLK